MGSATFDTPRLGVSWRRPAGGAVDRGEALAQTADDRDALGAQMRDLGSVHDARSRVQQVMGFGAARRGGSEEVEIGTGELRSIERLAVAIVAAKGDDVVLGTGVEQRQRSRQIGGEGAAAPGVERVAVAGDETDLLCDLGPGSGCERRHLQIHRGGEVEDQLGQPAGRGDDPDPPPGRRLPVLERRQYFGQLDQVRDFDRTMRAQQFGDRWPGRRPRRRYGW